MDLDILTSVVCEDAELRSNAAAHQRPSNGECSKRNASWSTWEDQALIKAVQEHGPRRWSKNIAKYLPNRVGKQCRERWHNHLDPTVRKGPFTHEETKILFDNWPKYPRQWSKLASLLPGRTDNAVKNQWHNLQSQQDRRSQNEKAGLASRNATPIVCQPQRPPVKCEASDHMSEVARGRPQNTAAVAISLKIIGDKLQDAGMDVEAARVKAWQVALEGDDAGEVDLQKAALEASQMAAKLRTDGEVKEKYCDGFACNECENVKGPPKDNKHLQATMAEPVMPQAIPADIDSTQLLNSHTRLAEAMLSDPSKISPADARQLAASVLTPTLKQLAHKLQAANMDVEAARVKAWQVALEGDDADEIDLQKAALEAQALAAKLGARARADRLIKQQQQQRQMDWNESQNMISRNVKSLNSLKAKWRAQRGEVWYEASDSAAESPGEDDFDLSLFVSEKNKYGYRGVFRDSRLGKYYSQLQSNHEKHFLGLHDTVEQAATAWAKKYLEVYGVPPASAQKRSQRRAKRPRQDDDMDSEESDLKEARLRSHKDMQGLSNPISPCGEFVEHCGEFVIESYATKSQLVAS